MIIDKEEEENLEKEKNEIQFNKNKTRLLNQLPLV